MAINQKNNYDDPLLEINTTPLIDVLLVLLVMLIITIPLSFNAVSLQLPSSNASTEKADLKPTNKAVIKISADGVIKWNDEFLSAPSDLSEHLKQLVQSNNQSAVQIYPHQEVAYEVVISVLSAINQAGLVNVSIVADVENHAIK